MKTILTFVLFVFLAAHLFSQVTIEGVLRLGDTSQILEIETRYGDHFIGSVSSWSKDTLVFQLNTGDLLHYVMGEVKKIKAYDRPIYEWGTDFSHGQFIITSKDGKVRNGQFLNMNQQGVRVKYMRNRRAYIRTDNLEEVIFDTATHNQKNENQFRLRLKWGSDIYGHLLHIDRDFVRFQPAGSAIVKINRSDVLSIYQKKGFSEITGYRRTLLLTPTGFNLKKGESEFRNIDFLTYSFSTGFSDHISGTVGLFGIEPYFQLKAAHDFNPLLHVSAGAGISLAGAAGLQLAVSIGTPDEFLNFGFMKNKGELTFGNTDMDAFFVGGSYRIGNRQRIIGEFIHLVERRTLFDPNGFGTNTFAFGYGWFARRVSLNLGLMLTESIDNFCFGTFGPVACDDEKYYFIPIPIISTSVYFGRTSN